MTERHFTRGEAEALIPRLTEIMERVMKAHGDATARQDRLREVRQHIELAGGGVIDRGAWRDDAEALRRATDAIRAGLADVQALGGAPKDLTLGLVDFPCLRDGRTVNLCWKYGERDIRFWHGLDEGYAARKPL
jgi:hypothetical protein